MQVQHLKLRCSGGGHGRIDGGVGRDERMTEDRDRVVDRPDHEAHLGAQAPGIGFAIPSNMVQRVANELIDRGRN